MSNSTDLAKADAFLKFGSRLIAFRIPTCRPSVDYVTSFKSSTGNEDAAQFINQLAQARLEMINCMYLASFPYNQKISILDEYLLQVYRLSDYFTQQKLQLDRELMFEWRGAITDKPDFSKSSDIVFEIMFLLHTKAILHSLAAKALVDTDPVAFLTESGKHLLEASSIMTHLSDNISAGPWNKVYMKKGINPIELNPQICTSLAALFKGQAQSMAFMKANSTGSTVPASIKSRLAVGVCNTMAISFDSLFTVPDATTSQADLLTYIHVTIQFYKALAYQYSAQVYLEKTEVGNAIGFCLAAKARLMEHKSSSKPAWSQPGVPKFTGSYATLGLAVAHILTTLNQIQADAERDNKFVYFQPVPGSFGSNSSTPLPLPDLPAEASVMNPTAYQEPSRSELPVVLLEYKAKPSIFTSMFSGLVNAASNGTSAATAPVSTTTTDTPSTDPTNTATAPSAPPAALSDEAYAQSLQRQYDAEAKQSQQPDRNTAPLPPQQQQPPQGAPPAPRYNSLV